MSHLNRNFLKNKIENIAKKLNSNKKQRQSSSKTAENTNINSNTKDYITVKDSLSDLENYRKILTFEKLENENPSSNKNEKQKSLIGNKNYSSLCTKYTDNNSNEKNFSEKDIKKINSFNKADKINNNNEINIYKLEILIKNSKIEINLLKDIYIIYESLIKIFSNYRNLAINNSNKVYSQYKILSYEYMKFVLSNDLEKIINIFIDFTEVNKFILYQIYLFLNIIYLDNDNNLNDYYLISYKIILSYSYQNFQHLLNIIEKNTIENRIYQNILYKNKIIISILRTITTNVPTNQQIIYFTTPNNISKFNLNENNNFENKNSIIDLLNLLNKNKDLNDKMLEIEKIIPNILINSNNKNNKKVILQEMNKEKYTYSILIELDETIVHYCEDGDNYYAKVRLGLEEFLKNLNKFCEIIIVSTSGKEYSNIIIDNIDKEECHIDHRIYIEDYELNGLNLSTINRDMKKTIFVCHEKNFLNAPTENIINLKEFTGQENDKEIIKLGNEIQKLKNEKIKDIREYIPVIRINLEKEDVNNEE